MPHMSTTNFFCFFSSSSGPPLDLLSFPTRRSSDLITRSSEFIPTTPRRECFPFCSQMSLPMRSSRDRKSTRLNSSHTVISYAVFCLKKKKNDFQTKAVKAKMPAAYPSQKLHEFTTY